MNTPIGKLYSQLILASKSLDGGGEELDDGEERQPGLPAAARRDGRHVIKRQREGDGLPVKHQPVSFSDRLRFERDDVWAHQPDGQELGGYLLDEALHAA